MESLAYRSTAAHQRHKAPGEVTIAGHRPKGLAVSVNNDLLSIEHTLENLPGPVLSVYSDRNRTVSISVAGADNSHRESLLAPLAK